MHVDACSHHPVAAQYYSDQALHVFKQLFGTQKYVFDTEHLFYSKCPDATTL